MKTLTAAIVLLLVCTPLEGANDDWASLHKAFKNKFRIDGLEKPGVRSSLRGNKRSAVKSLGKSNDGRALGPREVRAKGVGGTTLRGPTARSTAAVSRS